MRRRLAFLVVLAISLSVAPRSTAVSSDCSQVLCGMYCITHNAEYGGYCNMPAEETTGCVQLVDPGCGSLVNAYCCRPIRGAASF